jgi:hypothetical protein
MIGLTVKNIIIKKQLNFFFKVPGVLFCTIFEQCGQGRSYCSLCTLDTIHKLFFVTRLIINKINKVQWVDFKLENVLVSLHSLKTMGLGTFGASAPLFLRNGELLGHSPIRKLCTQ